MILIGLTGGIGTGKSTAAKVFHKLGLPTIDTDKIAHLLMKKGSREYKRIVRRFPNKILDKNKEISHKELADIVFAKNGEKFRKILERILHPAIWQVVKKITKNLNSDFVVVEVPLLFEVGWDKKFDVTVVVHCPRRSELKRCSNDFKKRISFQMPIAKKIKLADYIIDSSGSHRKTFAEVKKLLSLLKKSY